MSNKQCHELKQRHEIEAEYIADVKRIIKEAKDDLGYVDPSLAYLISVHGEIGATEELLSTQKIQDGFTNLAYIRKRPDLTIEYLVVSEKFRQLFKCAVVKEAERRLGIKQCS